ncbi:cytochrome bd-I oxidase subunit CydX [Ruixingdingia sedimenti]|jgi:cytochrome bd-I ubiquinol oxidase subunit X|uniref:Cytochrome bd-I oxidase subunit CydX n=1 Tax=Ruixingdingia sedimenti TaxID=3073604 RepID=A0ABU1F5W9_9RHOB|nr:cytochrome bd-I oxidase subunit CydX [Xinfangfangia sp. LG-4]MDR5652275.1 cytochrome bd-I oxidase subunit CydX [Xinfangfangia sp. LG-4]
MWYFAWILGLPLAAIFAVMNAMWLELKEDETTIARGTHSPGGRAGS